VGKAAVEQKRGSLVAFEKVEQVGPEFSLEAHVEIRAQLSECPLEGGRKIKREGKNLSIRRKVGASELKALRSSHGEGDAGIGQLIPQGTNDWDGTRNLPDGGSMKPDAGPARLLGFGMIMPQAPSPEEGIFLDSGGKEAPSQGFQGIQDGIERRSHQLQGSNLLSVLTAPVGAIGHNQSVPAKPIET